MGTGTDPGDAERSMKGDKKQAAVTHYLLLAAILLAALAYWAPWIDHNAAALKLSGQDMGEFVKFLPDPHEGEGSANVGIAPLPRQLFYVPPLACLVCLVLLAANQHMVYRRWLRVGMLVCALLLLPGLLPPAWGHPKDLFTAEFRLQGIALILGFVLILGHGLFRRVPLRGLAVSVGLLALAALVLSQSAFWAILNRLWVAYGTPTAHLGWGLWLHIVAWLGVIASAAVIYVNQGE
jgi:hypothetical protein